MGAVWSGRDKKRTRAPSVYATVDQFNAVSYRVIATVLKWPDEPIGQRALIIDRWIVIAQVRTRPSHREVEDVPTQIITYFGHLGP